MAAEPAPKRDGSAAGAKLNARTATAATFIGAAAFALAADLLTKRLAFACLDRFMPRVVIPGFLNLARVENHGAVWGFGQGMGIFFILFTLVAIPVMIWAAWKYGRSSFFLVFGLGCVLGGALGNLWDRVVLSGVRDFIDVHVGDHHWPTFNIADAAICVGVAVLLIHSFRTPDAPRESADAPKSPKGPRR